MAIRFYFRKIDIIGKERLPETGAVVFVVNHPSALLDPLVVAILAGRHLHFLAAAEFFGGKFTSWIFKRQFNMIPVYRPEVHQTTGDETEQMFQHCNEALSNDKAIIIFPEGTSETEKRVRKLKTGAVRMVLGAQQVSGKQIPIVPIGINYTNPHRFQSDVLVSVGEPIPIDTNNGEDLKSQVSHLTMNVEESLKQNVIHIEEEYLECKVERVEQIFAKQLQEDLHINDEELERKFILTKKVIEAIEFYESKSNNALKSIYAKMDDYYKTIDELPMHGRLLNHINSKTTLIEYLIIALLSPILVIGFLINGLPFYLSSYVFKHKFLSRIKASDEEHQIKPVFGGSIAFGIGTISFIIWYLLVLSITLFFLPWWWCIIFVATAYLSGQTGLRVIGMYRRLKEKRALQRVIKQHPLKTKQLFLLHSEIIQELQQFAEEYIKLINSKK